MSAWGFTPAVPSDLIAGNIASSPDMNELCTCCNFLLTKPIAHVSASAGQSITSSSGPGTAMNWALAGNQDFDPEGMFSAGNPSRLTVQTPGFYKVRYSFSLGSVGSVCNGAVWGTSGPNNPEGSGFTIGSGAFWGSYGVQNATTNAAGSSGVYPFYLYVGDYLQLKVYGSSSFTTGNLVNANFFSMEWVSS